MDRIVVKREPSDDDDRDDSNADNNDLTFVASTTPSSASHDRKRARTSSAPSASLDASATSAAAASSSASVTPTTFVTIPLAELTALQQQLIVSERARAEQVVSVQQQLIASERARAERVDTLSQQLLERADRNAALSAEREQLENKCNNLTADRQRQHEQLTLKCNSLSTELQRQRDELEREREAALAQRQTIERQCDARVQDVSREKDAVISAERSVRLLFERAYGFEVHQRPQLERQLAHRPLALATTAIESLNPLSRLSQLPRLGPLQLVSRYVHAPRLFVVGGLNGTGDINEAVRSLLLGSGGSWTPAGLYSAIYYVGAASVSQRLHWCGGLDARNVASSNAFSLHERVSSFRFDSLPSLTSARECHGLHACRDLLIAVGGFAADHRAVACVESLRPGATLWSALPDMPQARGACASCVLGSSLHVAGGSDAVGGMPASEHRRLDLRSGEWISCASLSAEQPKVWPAAAAVCNSFVVTGGWLLEGPQPLVLLYDPRSDQWHTRAPLSTPRIYHSAAVLDDRLFVLGGKPATAPQDYTASVEEYDFAADRWRVAPFALPEPLDCFSAAIVE